MKISVLIPTHNRPQLFERCITSVFDAFDKHPVDLQIIVNNDSHDIEEFEHGDIVTEYFYRKHDNLSDIYRLLFDRATGEYVYFLEDDDIMQPDFFKTLSEYNDDVFYFNYMPYRFTKSFVEFFKYTERHANDTKEQFLAGYDPFNFQFGQICFRKQSLPIEAFPTDNNLHNDFSIFVALNGTFRALPSFLYKQTTDGQDNISFKALNKDPRWIS